MKVVYIAGPFRASTPYEVELNVRAAETAALEVASIGYMPLCPHTNTRFFDGLLTAKFWLEGTLELMRRCDAVYLLPSWRDSSGTLGEIAEAKKLGIPIFEFLDNLRSLSK